MLPDRDTGSLVEVDIVIEETIAGHQLLIGIECTAGKRKATVEWYREMLGKHRSLPIAKTVLVSESGFTREVHKKALKDNVSLMTPVQVEDCNWNYLLTKLNAGTVADVGFKIRKFSIFFSPGQERASCDDVSIGTDIQIGEHRIPIGHIVMKVAKEGGLTRMVMTDLANILKKTDHFSFRFSLPERSFIVIDGNPAFVTEIEATLSIHPRYQRINWRPVDVGGQKVVAGTFQANFLFPGATGDAFLTASYESKDDFKVKLLDPDDNDIELEVFPDALKP